MISVVRNPEQAEKTMAGAGVHMHGFHANFYEREYPDVSQALQLRQIPSLEDHYYSSGYHEGRYKNAHHKLSSQQAFDEQMIFVDRCAISSNGVLNIIGWTEVETGPDVLIHIFGGTTSLFADGRYCRSYRRSDVEAAFPNLDPSHQYGFMITIPTGVSVEEWGADLTLELSFADRIKRVSSTIKRESKETFLSTLLGFLHKKEVHGSYWASNFDFLGTSVAAITADMFESTIAPALQRYSILEFNRPEDDNYTPSFSHVIVLYKNADLIPLQLALFASCSPEKHNAEFVYVVNGTDIASTVREVVEANLVKFDIHVKVVIVSRNVGFGAANNVGASVAEGRYLLITNPDVFPKKADLYDTISEAMLESGEHNLVGGWLYYADGSVMHCGMCVEYDTEVSREGQVLRMPRVSHSYKGYGESLLGEIWGEENSLEVEAITGAWIAIAREVFQRVGGFSTRFVFGHYEDAELCIRARMSGLKCVVDKRVQLWHLEGKGSESNSPQGLGATLVNRWLFADALQRSALNAQ